MFEKLNNLVDTANRIREQLQSEGRTALQEALVDFFDAHPEVEGIRWNQYTPYFMDGDPCVFSVNYPYVKFNSATQIREHVKENNLYNRRYNSATREYDNLGPYSDEELMEQGEAGDGWWSGDYELDEKSKVGDDLRILYKGLDALDNVLQDVFGDHIQVTCTRQGIETDEYEHE